MIAQIWKGIDGVSGPWPLLMNLRLKAIVTLKFHICHPFQSTPLLGNLPLCKH